MSRFAVALLPLTFLGGTSPAPPVSLQEIAAALRGVRLVEPRFSGGFDYAPCVAVTERARNIGTAQCSAYPEAGDWTAAALDRLAERLERGVGARRPLAMARVDAVLLALLAGGRRSEEARQAFLSRSVAELERLVRIQPKDPGLLNDLGATFYLRGVATDDPVDLVRALDSIEQAYALAPTSPEIRFNRALVLDRLHLVFLARKAWLEVVQADPGSGWAEEAEARLAVLDRPSLPERWRNATLDLEKAALAGQQSEVERLVRLDLQAARRLAMEGLLGGWGERVLAGGLSLGDRELRIAAAVGAAILALTGEASAAHCSSLLRAVVQREGNGPQLARLAQGHVAYREGQQHLDNLRTSEALERFEAAIGFLEGTEDPAALWARGGRARALAYSGQLAEAKTQLESLTREPRLSRYPALRAWTEWGLGWIAGRQLNLEGAFVHLRSAFQIYSRIEEGENAAFLGVMLADASSILGRQGEAWRYRLKALAELRDQPLSARRHTLLMEATRAEERESRDWSSLAFQTENLMAAELRANETWLAEALWSRARALQHVGRVEEGIQHLADARFAALKAPPGAPREKLLADLLLAEGEALAKRDPDRAFSDFDAAIRGYSRLGASLDMAVGSLLRAEAALAADRSAEAELNFAGAMSGFERVARNAGAMDLRLSYSDSVQRAYDSMILLQARTRRDPLAALGYLERAKNLALGTSITTGRDAAATRWRAAADNSLQGAVVAFAVLEDRVLRWTMVRGAVTFEEKPIARRDLVTLVEGFVDSIRRVGSNRGDPRFESALSDLLLPADLSELNEGEPITFVPDRELFLLPFAALVPNGKEAPLVSRHPVSISLSLRRERAEGERATPLPRSFSFLLVGNPATARSAGLSVRRLPGAEEEVARVSRLAGPGRAVILTGGQAIKERVMAEISKHEVFTFAGHSVSDPDLPSRSHLLLAPSTPSDLGVLAAAELEGKDLGKLRLVVLSSCSSLGSRASRSAGVAGIARPFLEAPGVDVLGTLWPIADRVSADFLLDFYERLEEGKDPRTALWLAQKRAAQGARSRRPMTWAAYEMITPNL